MNNSTYTKINQMMGFLLKGMKNIYREKNKMYKTKKAGFQLYR